jgi:hypothetical protein
VGEVEHAVDHVGLVGSQNAGAGAFAGEVEELFAGNKHFAFHLASGIARHGPAQDGVDDERNGAQQPGRGVHETGQGEDAPGGGGLEEGLGDILAEDEDDEDQHDAGGGRAERPVQLMADGGGQHGADDIAEIGGGEGRAEESLGMRQEVTDDLRAGNLPPDQMLEAQAVDGDDAGFHAGEKGGAEEAGGRSTSWEAIMRGHRGGG